MIRHPQSPSRGKQWIPRRSPSKKKPGDALGMRYVTFQKPNGDICTKLMLVAGSVGIPSSQDKPFLEELDSHADLNMNDFRLPAEFGLSPSEHQSSEQDTNEEEDGGEIPMVSDNLPSSNDNEGVPPGEEEEASLLHKDAREDASEDETSLGKSYFGDDDHDEEDEDNDDDDSVVLDFATWYQEIMQHVYTPGAKVWVKFGTAGRACWYRGSVVAVVSPGLYHITYDDGDESDMSRCFKPVARLRHIEAEDEYLEIDHLSDSSDEEEEWMMEATTFKQTKATSVKRTSHETMASRLSRDGKLISFPKRRCWQHAHSPRLYPGIAVVKFDRKLGSTFCGVIRQIFQDPHDKEKFVYLIRSLPEVKPTYQEQIKESDFIHDCDHGVRYATTLPGSSSSSTSSDVYLLPTKGQKQRGWPPMVNRYFHSRGGRHIALQGFYRRHRDPAFLGRQEQLLESLWGAILSSGAKPPRPEWKAWVTAQPGSSDHVFQLLVLLLQSNSARDDILAISAKEMFSQFGLPFAICQHPASFYYFLTTSTNSLKDDTTTDMDGDGPSISKGYNYCYQKAQNVIKLSKQLVALAYSKCSGTSMERLDQEPWLAYGSMDPVPSEIIDSIPQGMRLLPDVFDPIFLNRLQGVGPKIRNLVAEAGYGTIAGPALDCHMMRYTVCLGVGAAAELNNAEHYTERLKDCFQRAQWQMLNEVPASIGQLLYTRKHHALVKAVRACARDYDLEDEILSFVNHYPPQEGESDSLISSLML